MATDPSEMYQRISQLSNGRQPLRLRVFHVWDGTLPTKPGEIVSFNALLIDEEGNQVQVTCYPNVARWFRSVLIIGSIVTVTNFSVEPNFRIYRYAVCENYIRLKNTTVIKRYIGEHVHIPASAYRFTPLNMLTSRGASNIQLTDVIGFVVAVTFPNAHTMSGKQPPAKVITLRDASHCDTKLVVWGVLGDHLGDDLLVERSKFQPICLACTGLAIKMIDGETRLWTTSGSTIKVNEEIPVYSDYRERFHRVDIKINRQSFPNSPRLIITRDVTLAQLVNEPNLLDKDQTYICAATIVDIDDSKGWSYNGCPSCRRSVVYRECSYCCSHCGDVESTVPKYKVTLNVTDGNNHAAFLCFETAGRKLFNKMASEVVNSETVQSIPVNLRESVKGMERKFHVTLGNGAASNPKITFLVNNLSDVDASPSGVATSQDPVKVEGSSSTTNDPMICTPQLKKDFVSTQTPESFVSTTSLDDEDILGSPSDDARNVKRRLYVFEDPESESNSPNRDKTSPGPVALAGLEALDKGPTNI